MPFSNRKSTWTWNVTTGSPITDNSIVRWDWWGTWIQDSKPTIDDNWNIQNVDGIDMDLTPTSTTHTPWRLRWNATEHTVDIDTDFTDNTLQVNQETVIPVINNTWSIIPNASVVRFTWATAWWIVEVWLVQADNIDNIRGNLFVTTTELAIWWEWMVTVYGKVRWVDTSSYSVWDELFVSPTVAWELTNVKPSFPNYTISMWWVITSAVSWIIWVEQTTFISDSFHDAWDWAIRETFDFRVSSNWTVITWTLENSDLTNNLTLVFSDWLTTLDTTTTPLTVTLTALTDTVPQPNYVYIPKSTKVLTVSTTEFPSDEHTKIAYIVNRSASATQTDDALCNQNWNDHVKTTGDNGHLLHITEKLRQLSPDYISWVKWSSTITWTPSEVYVANTAWVIFQLHKQTFPAYNTQTGDDLHIYNDSVSPYKQLTDIAGETLDANWNSLTNSSFSFVLWGIQNKTGEKSHLMINKPTGKYAKNDPDSAVSDALNYSVYEIPSLFKSTWFLIARFTYTLDSSWTTWTLYDTEDLTWRIPNSTAWWGGGGTWVTEFTQLTDVPSSYLWEALNLPQVNSWETALEFTNAPTIVGTNISWTAASLTSWITNALKSATTTVNTSSATAPTAWQVLKATSSTTATWQTQWNLSNQAISRLLSWTVGISNTTTENIEVQVTYTGNGTSQSIVTNIESRDINYSASTSYTTGQLAFDRTTFKLWKALQASTGQTLAENAYWTEVADDTVESHPSSKVWIKSRSSAQNNVVSDTSRWAWAVQIITNTTGAESAQHSITFTSTWFTLNDGNNVANGNTLTYVAWQQAYHKVYITTTNQSKRALVVFDDVSNRSMVLYQGSGITGHEIPHGLGVEPKIAIVKNLDQIQNWYVNINLSFSLLNGNDAFGSTTWGFNSSILNLDDTSTYTNSSGDVFVAYCEANSDNIQIGTYSGTGVSGNKINLPFKPACVIQKRIDSVGNWSIYDNARGATKELYPNLSNAEGTGQISFNEDGFTWTSNVFNYLGGEFLYIAYADTDADWWWSETDLPSLTSNLQLTSWILWYSDGYDSDGANNSTESHNWSITVTLSEWINYVKKTEGSTWTATLNKPVFWRTSSTSDYYLNWIWYNSSDVAYATPITYLQYAIEADIDGNVVNTEEFIHPDITTKSISAEDITGLNKPIFIGYMSSDITSGSLIFPWTTMTDTHSAMNGGIWTCPKTWYYKLNTWHYHLHESITATEIDADIYQNGSKIATVVSKWNSDVERLPMVKSMLIYAEKWDTLYTISITASATHYISWTWSTVLNTYLILEYVGDDFTS